MYKKKSIKRKYNTLIFQIFENTNFFIFKENKMSIINIMYLIGYLSFLKYSPASNK